MRPRQQQFVRLHAAGQKTPGGVLIAMAVVVGIIIGRWAAHDLSFLPWWVWCMVALVVGLWPRCPRHGLVVVALLAMAWSSLHRQTVDRNDLMTRTGLSGERLLARVEGRVTSVAGTRMHVQVSRWHSAGRSHAVHGRLSIRLPEAMTQPLMGHRVRVTGWLHAIDGVRRPDQPDWLSLALDGTYRGWMTVEHPDLIQVQSTRDSWFKTLRGRARSWVDRILLGPPVAAAGPVRSLLLAVLLGRRDHLWPRVAPPFRRLGVAHLLAISGMHLGLIAGMILLSVRGGRSPRLWHIWVVLLVVLAYLFVVQLRPPIVRAGVMTLVACVGALAARRYRGIGLLALAALLVLFLQPGQIARAGFQLSFGVVAALLVLAPHVRRRWFGPRSNAASTPREVMAQWGGDTLAVSVTAWVVSAPVVVGHFGQLAWLAVPMGLLLLPLVALILGLAMLRIATGLIPGLLPGLRAGIDTLDGLIGAALNTVAELVLWVVDVIDSVPGVCLEPVEASWIWVMAATSWSLAWCVMERRRHLLLPALGVIGIWLAF